ncbi:hypothetical protein [Rhizobium sp. 2MFCol3.1]|uniref:hypothetical protein n=1 Tax=Rhizobium sp. 2MFCol3.1 TaxID=1246459 RepID=UPI0012DC7455|nr:hypothetical protein [Rhizobium sp. 2MFCol3.1]
MKLAGLIAKVGIRYAKPALLLGLVIDAGARIKVDTRQDDKIYCYVSTRAARCSAERRIAPRRVCP